MDVDEVLARTREEILKGLISLAAADRPPETAFSYRTRAQHLIEELAKVDRLIAEVAPKQTFPYAKCEFAIDAVIGFLKDHGRPATDKEIIQGALAGGFKGMKPGAELRLRKSIDAHIKASKGKTQNPGPMGQKIKQVDGLIGLHEWDDSRFRPLR
jgi:hypothetical protein